MPSTGLLDSRTATDVHVPSLGPVHFLKLPENVRDRIYYLSCPEVKVYPLSTGVSYTIGSHKTSYTLGSRRTAYTIKLEKCEGHDVPRQSTARHQAPVPPPTLLVSKQLLFEVYRMVYLNFTHVLPRFRYIPLYLNILKPMPNLLYGIKSFEVSFTAWDDGSSLIDSGSLIGKLPSCAEARIPQLVCPQDEISRYNRLAQNPHGILLKSLLQVWELKKAQLLKLIGPERIILRLDQAICRGGCHRLHRYVLFIWMDAQNRLPTTLRIKDLPPGEVLSVFVTEIRETKWPAPTVDGPIAQEMLEHYLSHAL